MRRIGVETYGARISEQGEVLDPDGVDIGGREPRSAWSLSDVVV